MFGQALNRKGLQLNQYAIEGNVAAVERLLNDGVDIESRAPDGATPLLSAGVGRNCESLDSSGGLQELKLSFRRRSEAELKGQYDVMKLLLDRGANIRAGGGAILHATLKPTLHPELLPLLIRSGANIETRDESGFTPLMWCIKKGYVQPAKQLIEAGANVEATNPDPAPVPPRHPDAPKVSMDKHALPFGCTGFDVTVPVGMMRAQNDGECGWDAVDDFSPSPKSTPIHGAIYNSNEEHLKMLLDAGAKIEAINSYGLTPLMVASEKGLEKMARMLVEKGANVNAVDCHKGWSSVQFAKSSKAQKRSMEIIEFLLKHGAKADA